MEPGDPPAARLARPAPGRAVALPRPGAALRAPRLRCRLQADHPRPAVVPDPAAAHHANLHHRLRQLCQPAHRRATALPVLPGRQRGLVLLRRVSEQDRQHLRRQRRPVRQGVLPAPGRARFHPDLQPDRLQHPVWSLPGIFDIFLAFRRPGASQCLGFALPRAAAAARRAGAGLWHHRLLAHHPLP